MTPPPYPSGGSGDATSLQGVPVLSAVPMIGNVLGFNGDEWQPIDALSVLRYTDPLTVTEIDGLQYLTLSLGSGLYMSGVSVAVKVGTGLVVNGSNEVAPDFGSGAGKVVEGNNAALSNERTPTDGSVTAAKLATGAVDLAGTKVTGTLPKTHGGTGSTTGTPQRVTASAASIVLGARRYLSPSGALASAPVVLVQLDATAQIDGLIFCVPTAPGVGQSIKATVIVSADYGATWTDTGLAVELTDTAKYETDAGPITGSGAEMYALALDSSAGCLAVAGGVAAFNVRR